ncbi:MAG: hypothetical protein WA949_20545 [Phormidesmis sp.]
MVLPIIGALIAIAVIAGIIALMTYVMAITDMSVVYDRIVEAIRDNDTRLPTDEDKERAEAKLSKFVMVDETEDGKYETVTGVFNKDTGKVLDGRKRTSEDIDDALDDVLGDIKVVSV